MAVSLFSSFIFFHFFSLSISLCALRRGTPPLPCASSLGPRNVAGPSALGLGTEAIEGDAPLPPVRAPGNGVPLPPPPYDVARVAVLLVVVIDAQEEEEEEEEDEKEVEERWRLRRHRARREQRSREREEERRRRREANHYY